MNNLINHGSQVRWASGACVLRLRRAGRRSDPPSHWKSENASRRDSPLLAPPTMVSPARDSTELEALIAPRRETPLPKMQLAILCLGAPPECVARLC